jgi:Flp pilus assembly pilin Flp
MSDLITTAQDKFRDECIDAFVGLQSFAASLRERARDNRGQTAAEYMGILFIVAVIIAAIVATPLADNIAKRVGTIVDNIGKGTKP